MACTSGLSARLSWVWAARTGTASGRPLRSVSRCRRAPGVPHSTGFGPVSAALFAPARWPPAPPPGTSRCPPARRADPAPGPQHVHDRGEHRPVIDVAGTAALRALGLRRNQRLDNLPQPVGHQPPAQPPPPDNTAQPTTHPQKTRPYTRTGKQGRGRERVIVATRAL